MPLRKFFFVPDFLARNCAFSGVLLGEFTKAVFLFNFFGREIVHFFDTISLHEHSLATREFDAGTVEALERKPIVWTARTIIDRKSGVVPDEAVADATVGTSIEIN